MANDRETLLQFSQAFCEELSNDDEGLKREILAHAGNRWSLGVLHILGTHGPLRHGEIGRQLAGVTQRMLTRTLRHLERDGLISRCDYQEKLPRVVYTITDAGKRCCSTCCRSGRGLSPPPTPSGRPAHATMIKNEAPPRDERGPPARGAALNRRPDRPFLPPDRSTAPARCR